MPYPPGMPMTPARPMPPGPATAPGGDVPLILNHTAQNVNPAYYYGVQPPCRPGYYSSMRCTGYNPYAYWAAMAECFGYDSGQRGPR